MVHGSSIDNEFGRASGWSATPLSQRGCEEAAQLGSIFAEQAFDRVYCSDLSRARSTYSLCQRGQRAFFVTALREANYGTYSGMTLENFPPLERHVHERFPEGESLFDVELRMRAFLDRITDQGAQEVAFISHQAPQLALEVICRGLDWPTAIANDWRRDGNFEPLWRYTYIGPGVLDVVAPG